MTWDSVRIEPSATKPGHAVLFLMIGETRLTDIVIAHLPIVGVPCKATVEADPNWRFMLDVLAGINGRHGREASVLVTASGGDRWHHVETDDG